MYRKLLLALGCVLAAFGTAASQPACYPHDTFYWMTRINKATILMNTSVGLLDRDSAVVYGRALDKVIREHASAESWRPDGVVDIENLIVEHSSPYASVIHCGRSTQDMGATSNMAKMRESMLTLADSLNTLIGTMLRMSDEYKEVVVPEFTNGVVAQPNSLGHVILAYVNAFMRDMDRLKEYYVRLDQCPMGTGVLNGSSWPLDRRMMASYLGFSKIAENAFDANQLRSSEFVTEAGYVCSNIAFHINEIIADLVRQYSLPMPWFLLKEGNGNTYASSAMPQKRNPGIINDTRILSSEILGAAGTAVIRRHNLPAGMTDSRYNNDRIGEMTTKCVSMLNRVLEALDIFPDRALAALKSDWSTSEELADYLMREHNLPFRIGHHYCSEVVSYAKLHNYTPSTFPYKEARRIYAEVVAGIEGIPEVLPCSEKEWRDKLDPVHMVQARVIEGGPQASEMQRMLSETAARHKGYLDWTKSSHEYLDAAEERLERDFHELVSRSPVSEAEADRCDATDQCPDIPYLRSEV